MNASVSRALFGLFVSDRVPNQSVGVRPHKLCLSYNTLYLIAFFDLLIKRLLYSLIGCH